MSPLEPETLKSSDLSVGALLVASLGAIRVLARVNFVRLKDAP